MGRWKIVGKNAHIQLVLNVSSEKSSLYLFIIGESLCYTFYIWPVKHSISVNTNIKHNYADIY